MKPPSLVATKPAVTRGRLQPLTDVNAPPRIVLNAVEGWGKTTAGAYAETPGILMAGGETGYETLLGANRVPSVPVLKVEKWSELIATVDDLIQQPTGIKTLVLDALGGFERMCHEHVCQRDFKGDWGERGFSSFQKGYDLSVTDWLGLLVRLDRLRTSQCVTILILSHCRIKVFQNPLGPNFDRYIADCHEKTWAVTHRWCDAVLFGTFETVTDSADTRRKSKGIGGTDRVLYTERRDAYDAKNRYGMPECLDIPNDPTQIWATITRAMKGVQK